MIAPPKPLSRAELAAAGRRKLEEFRRAKAAAAAAKQNAGQPGPAKNTIEQAAASEPTSTSNGAGTPAGGDPLVAPPTITAAQPSLATLTDGLAPPIESPAIPFAAGSPDPAQLRDAAALPPAPAAAAAAVPGGTLQPARLDPALVPPIPPPVQPPWGLQVANHAASHALEPTLWPLGGSSAAGSGYTALTEPPSFAALRPPPPPFAGPTAAPAQFPWQKHQHQPQVKQGGLFEGGESSQTPLVPATTTASDGAPKPWQTGGSAGGGPANVPGPGAAEAGPGEGLSLAAPELGVPEVRLAGSNSALVEETDGGAAAREEQEPQQGQQSAQGYQSRRPPPMPSLFDWRSALSRFQPSAGAAGSDGGAAAAGKSGAGRKSPAPGEPTAGQQPTKQETGGDRPTLPLATELLSTSPSSHHVTGPSSFIPPVEDPTIDLPALTGNGSSNDRATGPPLAPPPEGSFAAALAAFTGSGEEGDGKEGSGGAGNNSDRSGSGQEPLWAQRLQSAGSRGGGLFSSLFGKKGPGGSTADGGGMATGSRSSDSAASTPAAAAVPAGGMPSLPQATAGDLGSSDATMSQPPYEGGASPTKQRQGHPQQPAQVLPLRGLAGSYGALSDAYLAPQDAPAPAHPASSGVATLTAASTAQQSMPAAAGGYAALADSYAAPPPVPTTAAASAANTASGSGPSTAASASGRPAPKPSSSSSNAGGYSALSDAYLAPARTPASACQFPTAQSDSGSSDIHSHQAAPVPAPVASPSATSRSSSFASGYAALSDKYAAAPAAAGVAVAAKAPAPASLGDATAGAGGRLGRSALLDRSAGELSSGLPEPGQLPPLAAPSVHRPPVTPAPSQASLAAQGAGTGTATADTAAAAAASPGALPETDTTSRASLVGMERQGGAWSAAPPLPPRVPSTNDIARFTPPPSRGNDFKALQQHIDELTQEKFTLQRGLEQQSRLAGSLADENEALAQRYNEQAKQVDALQRDVAQLQQQLTEQAVLVERAAAERDAYKLSAQEAQSRAQSLAAEVVRLEEAVLRLRSQEIRVGREAEGATEVMRAMQSQLESLTRERSGLLTQLDDLRNDNAELRMALRAAEAGTAAAAAAPARLGASAAAGQQADAVAQPPPQLQQVEASELPETHAEPQEPAARDVSGPLARDTLAQHAQQARHASDDDDDDDDEEDLRHDRAASLLPPELMALLPSRVSTAAAAAGGGGSSEHPSREAEANHDAGSFATGDSVLALVQSIYMLLGALEADKRELLGTLGSKQDEVAELQDANITLHSRLEAAQQRIELLTQQLLRLGGGGRQKGGGLVPNQQQQQAPYANGSGGSIGKANGKAGWGWGGAQPAAVARRPGLQYLS
ncbi:hypothetical protein N2152v2_000398 [Parachlorella kessleri]